VSISITYQGGLGNNLFQYVASQIFGKKNKIIVNPYIIDGKFELPSLTRNNNSSIIEINDNNFMDFLSLENLENLNYHFNGFFQIKEFVLNYREEIKSFFNLPFKPTNDNEVFVAYRIGDIEGLRQMLPIEYYQNALRDINPSGGYITSDNLNHPNIIKLIDEFNLEVFNDTPNNTIDFAKNFNNLVLSEGTFSWWIGFLSNSKNIYYNKRERFWHGDIYVFPEWKFLEYDWDPKCVSHNNKLICDTIKKHED
jgi:hypothetical protein